MKENSCVESRMKKSLLSPRQAAQRLHVSGDTLDGLVQDGELPFVNVGRGKKRPRRMFEEVVIDAFIERRTQRGKGCTFTKSASRNTGRRKSGSRDNNIVDLLDVRIAERRKRLLAGLNSS
jgi:excisionase family DNA binding protein